MSKSKKSKLELHITPLSDINGVKYRVSSTSICGLWYVTNGIEHPGTRYLWRTDLRWHRGTCGETPADYATPHIEWPGFFETEEEARDIVCRAQKVHPYEHEGQRETED